MRFKKILPAILLSFAFSTLAQETKLIFPDQDVVFHPSPVENGRQALVNKNVILFPALDPCAGLRVGEQKDEEITILFIYDQTAAARSANAKKPNLQLRTELSVLSLDRTLLNNRICGRIKVVAVEPVDRNSEGDLTKDWMWVSTDPRVAALRDLHQADLVFFWVGVVSSRTIGLAPLFDSNPAHGFAVVYIDGEGRIVVHEFGHLVGADHQPEDPTVPTDTVYRGHYRDGIFSDAMCISIPQDCPNGCPLAELYSDPEIFIGGVPSGTSDRNNAAAVRKNFAAVARYRGVVSDGNSAEK